MHEEPDTSDGSVVASNDFQLTVDEAEPIELLRGLVCIESPYFVEARRR